jgi:hypothetical protein
MKISGYNYSKLALLAVIVIFLPLGCEPEFDELELATFPTTPEVFIDGFSEGLNYAAFGGSKVTAFDVDREVTYKGEASMRIEVPDFEDPEGAYAGGAYYTTVGRNLSGYDALTFWAKASKSASIDVIGFGNDLDEAKYQTTILGLPVNTNWKKYIIPIPDPSKLTQESGMLYYSEGNEDGLGYTFWIDEVKFEKLGTIAHPQPGILDGQDQVTSVETGEQLIIGGTFSTFNMPNGVDQRVEVAAGYFTFASTDTSVATVSEKGVVTLLGTGTSTITAKLGDVNANGSLQVEAIGALPAPPVAAPTPTVSADSVISMFSDAYSDVTVDTWNTGWEFSTAQLTEGIEIEGDEVKRYKNLNFVGIEFSSQTIDATEMTHFHLDIWTPDPTDPPAAFKVLLIDFGADGQFDGGDDVSHELTFTSPVLATQTWVSLDIPLSNFTGLVTRGHLAQLVLSGDLPNIYLDNVYFYNDGGGSQSSGPQEAAPDPVHNAADVVSAYSDSYTDVEGTNFFPGWGQATVASEVQISGNNTLLYSGLDYQGIELGSSQDVSGMDYLHLDFWTDNSSILNVYLISTGPVETAYALTVPTDGWVSVDIPLTAFSPVDLADVFQMKFDGNGDIYLDNIYFRKENGGGSPTEPGEAAPDPPARNAEDVISLFSDAYTDITVDTWRTDWSAATYEETTVAGNAVKKYSDLDNVGIETTSSTVDITGMTHFHIDVWSADFTFFGVKIVDFGADGAYAGGDDTEHELGFTPNQGEWVSFDIPMSDFTGLTTKEHIAQYILIGQPTGTTTIYVDNIYFYK